MQVPNVHRLLKSVSRGENTVNKLGEKKHICSFNTITSSNPSYNIKFLKMKWKKLDCLASQIGGSKNIFCEIFGDQKAENTFWLDSSSTEKVSLLFPTCIYVVLLQSIMFFELSFSWTRAGGNIGERLSSHFSALLLQ